MLDENYNGDEIKKAYCFNPTEHVKIDIDIDINIDYKEISRASKVHALNSGNIKNFSRVINDAKEKNIMFQLEKLASQGHKNTINDIESLLNRGLKVNRDILRDLLFKNMPILNKVQEKMKKQ